MHVDAVVDGPIDGPEASAIFDGRVCNSLFMHLFGLIDPHTNSESRVFFKCTDCTACANTNRRSAK